MARTYREIAEDLVATRKKYGFKSEHITTFFCSHCKKQFIFREWKNYRVDINYYKKTKVSCPECGLKDITANETAENAILDVNAQLKNLIERWGPE